MKIFDSNNIFKRGEDFVLAEIELLGWDVNGESIRRVKYPNFGYPPRNLTTLKAAAEHVKAITSSDSYEYEL